MSRRTLHRVCGIAVLFTSILYAHVLHHLFFVEGHEWNAAFVAELILAAIPGVFAFIGAYLLFTGGRQQS